MCGLDSQFDSVVLGLGSRAVVGLACTVARGWMASGGARRTAAALLDDAGSSAAAFLGRRRSKVLIGGPYTPPVVCSTGALSSGFHHHGLLHAARASPVVFWTGAPGTQTQAPTNRGAIAMHAEKKGLCPH
jgi:hypothetical protein